LNCQAGRASRLPSCGTRRLSFGLSSLGTCLRTRPSPIEGLRRLLAAKLARGYSMGHPTLAVPAGAFAVYFIKHLLVLLAGPFECSAQFALVHLVIVVDELAGELNGVMIVRCVLTLS